MFLPIENKDEIIKFAENVVNADDSDFRKKILKVLAKLSPSEWQTLESIVNKIKEEE